MNSFIVCYIFMVLHADGRNPSLIKIVIWLFFALLIITLFIRTWNFALARENKTKQNTLIFLLLILPCLTLYSLRQAPDALVDIFSFIFLLTFSTYIIITLATWILKRISAKKIQRNNNLQ